MADEATEEKGAETGVKAASSTSDKRLLPFIKAAQRRTGGRPEPAETPPAAEADPAETPAAATEEPAAPTEETQATTEEPAAPPDPKALSWEDIQRRDRELRAGEQAGAQNKRDAEAYRKLRQALAQDPLTALQAEGVDQGRILDGIIAKQGAVGDGDMVAELRALREEVKALKSGTQQAVQVAANTKAETREQARIRQHIEASDAEMVKLAATAGDDVLDEVINEAAQEFDRAGQPRGWRPNYPEIVKRLESRYTTDALALTQQLLRATKVKEQAMEWLGVKQAPPPGKATPPASATSSAGTRQAPVTLDNSLQEEAAPTKTKRLATIEEKRTAFLGHIRSAHEKAKERDRNR